VEIAKVYYTSKIQGKVPLVLDKSGGYNGAQVGKIMRTTNLNEKRRSNEII